MAAIATEFRRRKETVNAQDLPVSPLRFVLAEANELAPSCIRNGLCQTMILDHASDIQGLKRYGTVLVDQFTAQLVLKVFALVGYPFVQDGDGQPCLIAGIASFDLLAQAPLSDLQPALTAVQVLGLFDLVFIAQSGKRGQPQVNGDSVNLWCWVFNFHLYLNGDEIPTALGFRDGTVFHLAFNGAMENTLDPTYLWQIHPPVVDFEALRIADALLVVLAVEVRIVGAAFKEILVSTVKVFKRLLHGLTVGFFQPGVVNLENIRQVHSTIVVVQSRAGIQVEAFPGCSVVVIDKANMPELTSKLGLLRLIRVDSELERFEDFHWLEPFLMLHRQYYQGHRPSSDRGAPQAVLASCGYYHESLSLYYSCT